MSTQTYAHLSLVSAFASPSTSPSISASVFAFMSVFLSLHLLSVWAEWEVEVGGTGLHWCGIGVALPDIQTGNSLRATPCFLFSELVFDHFFVQI